MQTQPSSDDTAQVPTPAVPGVPGTAPATGQPTQPAATPEIADDGDLIEKDWVAKVRHIVGSNKHDPYVQSQQFADLKADYLLKRYGKVLNSKD